MVNQNKKRYNGVTCPVCGETGIRNDEEAMQDHKVACRGFKEKEENKMVKTLKNEAYHLPNTSLNVLVGIKEAEKYVETEAKKWKILNPDPYFILPPTFEEKCKKFEVVKFTTQIEWIHYVEGLRKFQPLSREVESTIYLLKKNARFDQIIKKIEQP